VKVGAIRATAFLGIVLAGASAYAQTEPPLRDFSALCIAERSRGFNWRNGDWVPVEFKEERYVVRKLRVGTQEDARKELTATGKVALWVPCLFSKQEGMDSDSFKVIPICISLVDFGEEPNSAHTQTCTENWDRGKGNRWELISITCDGFHFKPNGWFHRSHLHPNLSEKADVRKDSLAISVGKCSAL